MRINEKERERRRRKRAVWQEALCWIAVFAAIGCIYIALESGVTDGRIFISLFPLVIALTLISW